MLRGRDLHVDCHQMFWMLEACMHTTGDQKLQDLGNLCGRRETKNGHGEPSLANTCMHLSALGKGAKSFSVRSWRIPPALPVPGAQAVAWTSRVRHVMEQPARKQKASCSPCKACGQGLLTACPPLLRQDVVPGCRTPAGQHLREGAEMGSPT